MLRLRLDGRPEGLLDAVRPLAPGAAFSGDELVLPGPAAIRPALVDAVRAAGGRITSLTADEGRLDALYSELVGGPQ